MVFFLALFSWGIGFVQLKDAGKPEPGSQRLEHFKKHVQKKENSFYKNLEWRFVGPQWMSGCITDIAVPKGDPFTFYVASSSGGVWKTTNEGTTWTPLFEEMPSPAIGDIAVAPSDSRIIWVGTGEVGMGQNTLAGTGVFKSTSGGNTFKHMGLEDSNHIGRIVIHPKNPDIVYVAVTGSYHSYNSERGIYKTKNGGRTWEKVLFIDEKTGFADIIIDPSDPDVLYAASWARLRLGWHRWNTGPNNGIYKTTDGGRTWKRLQNGFPVKGLEGRIGLDISQSNPNVVYACIDNHDAERPAKKGEIDFTTGKKLEFVKKGLEVYRSDDKGATWRKVNRDHLPYMYFTYGYMFGQIRVNPSNENEVWILGVPLMVSRDGGEKFQPVLANNIHVDIRSMWIDPSNPDRLIIGNDGGINISYDNGKHWKHIKNLPVLELYTVNVDMATPFNIYVSAQDHGCIMGPSTHDPDYDNPFEWKFIPGFEASRIAVDPADPDTVYSQGFLGNFEKNNLKTGDSIRIKPPQKDGESKLRGTWLMPFIISPHNPFIIYWGSQYIHQTLDRGKNWQIISPDLTKNDPAKRGNMQFGTIFTISESPIKPGVIWAGTEDGNVYVTPNGGVDWTKIEGFENTWVTCVEASHFSEGTAYVSLSGYYNDVYDVYLYRTSNYGKKLTDIGQGIPGGPVNVIREDPKHKNVLYAGTNTSVYVSTDGGDTWDVLSAGLPTISVQDLVVHARDDVLVAGTWGRGVFVLDIAPLQQNDKEVQDKDIHVFSIRPAKLPHSFRETGRAVVIYSLKKAANVKATIINQDGKIVWQTEFQGNRGLNRFIWDLTTEGGRSFMPFPNRVPPGSYTARLTAGSHSSENILHVKRGEMY